MRNALYSVIALAIAILAHATPPSHRLNVSVEADRVLVQRATPGGAVLLIGYELTARDDAPVHRQVRYEAAAGPDGSIEVRTERPIIDQSFWVAFDLTSGGYGASTRAMKKLREAEVPERALRKNASGKLQKIEARLDYVHAVAIRPGVGVWELTIGDGGDNDVGGVDGKIDIVPGRLKKSATTSADLDEFREGDLIAIFAPHQMSYLITEVKK